MALTVTNTNTLQLLNILNRTSAQQATSLQRLSTGYRINTGKDDPAGLIAMQSLGAELTAIDAAIANGQRANSLLDTADGAFTEVNRLLNEVEGLVAASTSTAGLSNAEIAANQAQIDSALESINRLVNTTSFNGTKLLDGAQSVRFTQDAQSKVDISDVRIFSRKSNVTSQALAVSMVTIGKVASATFANTAGITNAEFTVTGKLGTATISVATGNTMANIRDKIIAVAGETGVSARVSGNALVGVTRETGTDSFLSVSYISGDTDFADVAYTKGTNAVVVVGGQQVTADGLSVSYNSNGVSGSFNITTAGNAAGSLGTVTVTDGGATFQLGTGTTTQATLGIDAMHTHKLGGTDVGFLNSIKSGSTNSLTSNATNALSIVKRAISQTASAQGRIGAFQKYTVDSTVNSLNATKKSLEDARSVIRDTDFAAETANLSRLQVLQQSAISLLGIAGQQTAQILSLLS